MEDNSDSLGLENNPLGRSTFDKDKFIEYFIDKSNVEFDDITEKSRHGNLAEDVGSRVHTWRVLLGLIPEDNNLESWVKKIRTQRKRFYQISDKYSIQSTKNLDPMMFNPLMSGKDNLWNEMLEDKDMRDTIYKDIIRTYQEYKFFLRKEIRDQMVSTLYYWSKTYPMFSYRQGMNEIIAVIYFVFYAEKSDKDNEIDKKKDSDIVKDHNNLIKFLFNEKHINADIFVVFERVMSMGIKELYGTIDDITSIKNQLFNGKSDDKDRLFKWKHEIEQEDKVRREKIEKIYDDERKKSAVMRRCNRIYHTYLNKIDNDVYRHLINVSLDPELQLMRWLRCILSREFNIDIVLCLWDYIFIGIQSSHRVDRDFGDMYYNDGYTESKDDPLINLDFLCLAMIENIRDSIYKKDVEDCLEVFFHYPEVKGASRLISLASRIEKAVQNNEKCGSEFFKLPSAFEGNATVDTETIQKEDYYELDKNNNAFEDRPFIEETKNEKPNFFDPLSNPGSKSKKPENSFVPRKQKQEESRAPFPSKRLGTRKESDNNSIEDLDNSPKASNRSKPQPPPKRQEESDTFKQNRNRGGYDELIRDEDEEVDNMRHIPGSNRDNASYNSTNIMNYISGGLTMINEKKRQYVDPLVKTGIKHMSEKWNHADQHNQGKMVEQRVIHEKLKKVRTFLESLKSGSSYEKDHRSIINIDVDEEKMHDILCEVETMLQITESAPDHQ